MTSVVHFTDTKEFYDLLSDFEKIYKHMRLDREKKEFYTRGAFYQSGETNTTFKAFLHGYQLGRANYMHG